MSKYVIRDGFVANIKTKSSDGKEYEKLFVGGEEVDLEDDVAAMHLHKLQPVVKGKQKSDTDAPAT